MPEGNAEVARALTELWNEGVRAVPMEYFDPAVELESPFSSVSGEPHRGHAGIERWARDVDEQFSEWQVSIEDLREVDDAVITIGRVYGRGRSSGIRLDQPYAILLDFASDHRITRVRIYLEVDTALKAAGLTAK